MYLDQVVYFGAAIVNVYHNFCAEFGRVVLEGGRLGVGLAAVDRQVIVSAVGRKYVLSEQLLSQPRLPHLHPTA